LWFGKKLESLVGHAVEEVAEAEKRERALRVGGSADEEAVGATTRGVDRCAPDGGLADPGFALENQRGRAFGQQVEEPIHCVLLPLPSDDLHLSTPRRHSLLRRPSVRRETTSR